MININISYECNFIHVYVCSNIFIYFIKYFRKMIELNKTNWKGMGVKALRELLKMFVLRVRQSLNCRKGNQLINYKDTLFSFPSLLPIIILICPFHYFRFTLCKQYRRRKFIHDEVATILPIRSTVVATGKLDVYNE